MKILLTFPSSTSKLEHGFTESMAVVVTSHANKAPSQQTNQSNYFMQ